MKVLKEIFKDKLQTAASFLKSSLTASAVSGVLLEASEKGIEIYSTDLSSFFHSTLSTEIEEKFSVVVEPKKVIEVLNTLSADEIELEVKEKKLVIKSGKTQAKFPTIEAGDYPKPSFKIEQKSALPEEIIDNLPLVIFSAATDEARPILTGVNFVKKEEGLVLVSTDGFRLSLVKIKSQIELDEGDHVVPADFLRIVLKEIRKIEEAKFGYNGQEKILFFSIGENEYSSRLIEGEFPPFEKVIPENFNTEVVLDKNEFLRNVKFASVFARDYSNVVILEVKKDGIYIYPKSEAETGESQAFQEGRVEGDEVKVAFNFKFLLEFLNKTPGEEVKIKIVKSEAPVVFEILEKEEYLHIIMPVRIGA